MKILVAGSSGMIGTPLCSDLALAGHTVCRLVRPESKSESGPRDGFAVSWNPKTGELGGAGVGPDAVLNLAGASIAEGRWSAERKELLRTSRVDTTRALVRALAKMNVRPSVMVSASAIGVYGDRGDETLTETSKAGMGFLAELTQEWEAEALKAEALGIRVVVARIGIVLAREGGALMKMLPPFKLGAGGRLGSGKQWMSWVTLEDMVGALRFALEKGGLRGAVNFVAPKAVQNGEFTKELARAVRRPALFPAPAFALRLALGEMADALLLSSQRVVPGELEKAGYKFKQVELGPALREILGKG